LPWGLLPLCALVLLAGEAFCRLFLPVAPVGGACPAPGPGERLFQRCLAGGLIVGWWALVLAELGWFGAGAVVLGVLALSSLLFVLGWRGAGRRIAARVGFRPTAEGITPVVLLLLAGWLFFANPFETIVGAEDAGVYFSSGGLIARTGAIRQADGGLAAFGDAAANAAGEGAARHLLLPPPGAEGRFLFLDWQRLSGFNLIPGEPNEVTPQFLHLFPAWLALWATFGDGVGAMVYASAACALLGVAATYFLGRRIFGPWVGFAAALFLTLNGLQLWFARQSLSEPLLQPLFVGALYAWALLVDARDGGDTATARGAALLAGLALGSVALTHAQWIFTLLPVAALLGWLWLSWRWSKVYLWFLLPFGLLVAHGAWHISRYSLGYFEGIYHHVWRNALRDWEQTTVMFLGPALVVALLGWRPLRERWLPLATDPRTLRAARWLGIAAAVAGCTWLYIVRPGILRPGNFGAWQGYIGAPIPPGAATSMVALGWYLAPLGMALALAGLALAIWRAFDERIAAALCLAAPFLVLYLTGTYTQGGYIYSLRRFVPLIVPLAALLAAFAVVRGGPLVAEAIGRPTLRRPLLTLGLGAGALLIAFFGYTNLRLIGHREYAGALDQVAALAERAGPDDIFLFSGSRDETPKLATPLRYLYGRESWVITTNLPDGELLDAWVSRQEAAGRTVHLLMSAGGGKLFLPNHQLVPADRITVDLQQFETLEAQKPFNRQRNVLGYTLYTLRPVANGQSALGTLPYRVVAGQADEFAQLGNAGTSVGFYNVETSAAPASEGLGGATAYRWTDGQALLRIPWPGDGRPLTLTLTLGAGPRPASLPPARVVVGLRPDAGSFDKEQTLATLTVGSEFATYTVTIPANALGPTGDGTAVIALGMPRAFNGKEWKPLPGTTWKPVDFPEETNSSADRRELHVRFVKAELTVGP
jgi:hypothetical protein